MDIMLPKLDQQVSPPPRLVTRRAIKLPQIIRRLLSESPDLSVDEIVARLKELDIQASGVIIAMWLARERRLRATAPRPAAAEWETSAGARSRRKPTHGLPRSQTKNRPADELSEAV